MKVLQVDAISNSINQSNVQGLVGAYKRVADLFTYDYREISKAHGQAEMNRLLLQYASNIQPDLIHLEKCEQVKGRTVQGMRSSTDAKIMLVFPDYRPEVPAYFADMCPYADWILCPREDARWKEQIKRVGGRKVAFWTRGVDPGVFRPHLEEKKYDLVMLAHGTKRRLPDVGHGERNKFLQDLASASLKVHLFGTGNAGSYRHVDLVDFAKTISATKISLAYNTNEVYMYCSWRRLFNTMASGGFILVHYFPGLEKVFKNRYHLVWFKNVDEAIELIRYYLTHEVEREEIALQGRKEVISYHTWDIRIKRMLNLALRDLDEPPFARRV